MNGREELKAVMSQKIMYNPRAFLRQTGRHFYEKFVSETGLSANYDFFDETLKLYLWEYIPDTSICQQVIGVDPNGETTYQYIEIKKWSNEPLFSKIKVTFIASEEIRGQVFCSHSLFFILIDFPIDLIDNLWSCLLVRFPVHDIFLVKSSKISASSLVRKITSPRWEARWKLADGHPQARQAPIWPGHSRS